MKTNLFKIQVVSLMFLVPTLAQAAPIAGAASGAEYIVETGDVVITGPAAIDLYEDIEAKHKVLESVTRQQTREKKSRNVRCEAELIRGLEENSNEMGDWSVIEAQCSIKLSPKIVGPR